MAQVKDNLVELEVVYSKLNKALDENISRLNAGATAVDNYNKKISVVPSEFQKGLQQIKLTIDEVKNSNIQLTKAEKESANAIIKTNQVIRSDIATKKSQANETKRVEAETKKLQIANEKLASAYNQLSQKEAESAKRVQDLIARGRTATQTQRQFNTELRTAQNEFNKYRARVLEADKAVGRWNRTGERSIGFMRNLVGAFGIAGGVTLFATIATDIFQTTKELQSLNNALKQVTDTQSNFTEQQQFLARISEAYGVELKGLTKQFTQFYVSAKDKISGREIQQIFESVTKAGASMGLSVEAQERAFLALNQMMSKGTVSAEELRGQLGEALPGAFGIMAKAIGVTEKQLGQMMKDGEVLASDVLPRFAKQLEITYGIENVNRVENLASAQTRLANSWTEFVASLDKNGNKLSAFLIGTLNTVTKIVQGIQIALESQAETQKRTSDAVNENAKKGTLEYLRSLKENKKEEIEVIRSYSREEINENLEKIKKLQAQNKELKKKENSVWGLSLNDKENLRENKDAIQELVNLNAYYGGRIKATYVFEQEINAKKKKSKVEETSDTKKNTKAKKEEAKVIETFLLGSIGWYEQQIKLLKEQADVIKANSTVVLAENEAYNKQLSIIADYQLGLEKLLGVKKDLIDNEGIALDLGGSEFITDADGDRLMEEGNKLRELLKEFKQGFIDDFADQSGFGKFLDILSGGLDKFEGDAVATALAVSDAFQEAFNTINELSNQSFENEYLNLEKRKETALMFAGDSATAQSEIERQAEEQRRAIAEREFKAKKKQALFNIAIDTAQAVMAQLASTPLPLGSGFVLTILGLGALQAGVVANRELPQYWTGTDNAKEGFALTQERGREIIMDRFGKIKDLGSDDGARLTKMKAGDKVLNNEKTMELLMFNSQFNSKLAPNLNTMPNLVVNNNTDFTPIIKAIQNKPETILNFDNGEFKKFVRNGNSIKETTQIRNGFKGLKV